MRGYAAIGLIAPKKEQNVGGVLRAVTNFGAAMVAVQGDRVFKYASDTVKTYRHIPVLFTDDIFSVAPAGADIVVVELHHRARRLPSFVHPESAFYIFGPEDGSVPEEIVSKCQRVVQIPSKFCLNLAAAVNVVLYDRSVKRGFDLCEGFSNQRLDVDHSSSVALADCAFSDADDLQIKS